MAELHARGFARRAWVGRWLCLGALPFMFSGTTTYYWDAFFETVSGLPLTGASILLPGEVAAPLHFVLAQLTHWVGGMGVLVLTLALMPWHQHTTHLARAESPGPQLFQAAAPGMKDTPVCCICCTPA